MEIKKIDFNSPIYPPLLKQISDPPEKLFILGNPEALKQKNNLAIVGTRKISSYGKETTTALSKGVCQNKIAIISGLARGVDGLAHRLALENNCPTIAILGNGLDQIYPPEHKNLAKEIINNGGALVSEYEPGTPPLKHHFPARNRIIAGLAEAVLVIEAPVKSGSLITAYLALDYNREVMAVPGNINNYNSTGTNKLIKLGAKMVTETEDILEFFGLTTEMQTKAIFNSLNQEENLIVRLLTNKALSSSEIIDQLDWAPNVALDHLTNLELEGVISKHDDGKFFLKI